ncbi:hypothetical protein [Streptomyces canus]|uniref:hypothetical protein n=1 Tax=Streptomyces canus TaxID=58343 RepID=UPI0033AE2347
MLVSLAYESWGSRRTIVALSVASTMALGAVVEAGNSLAHYCLVPSLLLVVPPSAISSVAAVVAAYAAEVYRRMPSSPGSGLAAGMSPPPAFPRSP